LVLNKYKAHLGVFWAATRRGLITPNYTVFRPTRRLSTEFFEHLFHTRAYRDTFSMVVYGVIEGMCPLYTEDFYRIPCLCPPHEEQVRIVGALVNMTKTEDTTISRLEREIELLREYRTRLVADVVTGKLDVRAMAAGLPEEGGGEGLGESDVSDMSDVSDSSDESLDAPLPEEEP
jgi:type I restriction enzyme S subunit